MLGFSTGVSLVRAVAQFHTLGGWHLGARLPRRTQLVAAMGSVFLYQSRGLSETELVQQLTAIEANGIGGDRARGLGRLAVCLPFHYQAEVNL
jgi:CRISPR/Cas system CSM-associated protein Csm4 (group 5 of RAMP superfamily)